MGLDLGCLKRGNERLHVLLESLVVGACLLLSRDASSGVCIVHEGGALADLVLAQNDVYNVFDGKNRRQPKDAREVGTAVLERIGPQVAKLPGEPSSGHIGSH